MNVCRPLSAYGEENFCRKFTSYFSGIKLSTKKFLLVGDFNFHLIVWERNRLCEANRCREGFLNFCRINDFSQVVAELTREAEILDLALVNNARDW